MDKLYERLIEISKLYERVKRILVEQLGVEEDEVTYDASFVDDLGADFFETVKLFSAFEEEFECEIPDQEVEKITKVKDLIFWLEKNCIRYRKTFPKIPTRRVPSLSSRMGSLRLRTTPVMTPKQPQDMVCTKCKGQGWIYNPSLHQLGPYAGSIGKITCFACNGSGRIRKFPG